MANGCASVATQRLGEYLRGLWEAGDLGCAFADTYLAPPYFHDIAPCETDDVCTSLMVVRYSLLRSISIVSTRLYYAFRHYLRLMNCNI